MGSLRLAIFWVLVLTLGLDSAEGGEEATLLTRQRHPEKCTFFVHLPKCGGSTIEHALRELLSDPVELNWVFPFPQVSMEAMRPLLATGRASSARRMIEASIVNKKESKRRAGPPTLFVGHWAIQALGVLEAVNMAEPHDCFVTVVLREPVSRAVSGWYYYGLEEKVTWSQCWKAPALACPGVECLGQCLVLLHNDATRKLSGGDTADYFSPAASLRKLPALTEAHWQAAKTNLLRMDAVLIMEYMEASIRLLECKLGLPVAATPVLHDNKGPGAPVDASVPVDLIKLANKWDLLLYRQALHIFADQLRACAIPLPPSLLPLLLHENGQPTDLQ